MVVQVLDIHYSNGEVLREYLNNKFPGQNYTASLLGNSWTVDIPQRLSQAEIDEVNEKMRVHYHSK